MPWHTKAVLSVVSSPYAVEDYCLVTDAFIVDNWIVDIGAFITAGADGLVLNCYARMVLSLRFIEGTLVQLTHFIDCHRFRNTRYIV